MQLHGGTHRKLRSADDADLIEETEGARAALAAHGVPPAVVFAYPHGDNDARCRRAVVDAGMRVAFTVSPGLVRPGRVNLLAVPRIEVLRRDGFGLRLSVKVLTAGRLSQLVGFWSRARGLAYRLGRLPTGRGIRRA